MNILISIYNKLLYFDGTFWTLSTIRNFAPTRQQTLIRVLRPKYTTFFSRKKHFMYMLIYQNIINACVTAG